MSFSKKSPLWIINKKKTTTHVPKIKKSFKRKQGILFSSAKIVANQSESESFEADCLALIAAANLSKALFAFLASAKDVEAAAFDETSNVEISMAESDQTPCPI
eukprot:GDKJ01054463.1.p1 GENE.GDKJ01054463.1~~GDKJ01054463.1.p1  ORF type:complete len:104 (-),score=41.08 GDKJ01054463.1:36-347(-)